MAVRVYGRGFFFVDSHSRNHKEHLVDIEPETLHNGTPEPGGLPCICSCESFQFKNQRPCRHLHEIADYLIFQMELPEESETQARKRMRNLLISMFQ